MAILPIISVRSEQKIPMSDNSRRARRLNVGREERLLSLLAGGALILTGVARFDLRGMALMLLGCELLRRGITGHDYLYKMLDLTTAPERPGTIAPLPDNSGLVVRQAMTIARSPEELYRFWRALEMAPTYMPFVSSVHMITETHACWRAKAPSGLRLEWETEITEDLPGQLIAWKTIKGTALSGKAGRVSFTPVASNRGTLITCELEYILPFGITLGQILGRLPEQEVRETLRHFKHIMEAGEIPTISRQPVGRGQLLSRQGRKK